MFMVPRTIYLKSSIRYIKLFNKTARKRKQNMEYHSELKLINDCYLLKESFSLFLVIHHCKVNHFVNMEKSDWFILTKIIQMDLNCNWLKWWMNCCKIGLQLHDCMMLWKVSHWLCNQLIIIIWVLLTSNHFHTKS